MKSITFKQSNRKSITYAMTVTNLSMFEKMMISR